MAVTPNTDAQSFNVNHQQAPQSDGKSSVTMTAVTPAPACMSPVPDGIHPNTNQQFASQQGASADPNSPSFRKASLGHLATLPNELIFGAIECLSHKDFVNVYGTSRAMRTLAIPLLMKEIEKLIERIEEKKYASSAETDAAFANTLDEVHVLHPTPEIQSKFLERLVNCLPKLSSEARGSHLSALYTMAERALGKDERIWVNTKLDMYAFESAAHFDWMCDHICSLPKGEQITKLFRLKEDLRFAHGIENKLDYLRKLEDLYRQCTGAGSSGGAANPFEETESLLVSPIERIKFHPSSDRAGVVRKLLDKIRTLPSNVRGERLIPLTYALSLLAFDKKSPLLGDFFDLAMDLPPLDRYQIAKLLNSYIFEFAHSYVDQSQQSIDHAFGEHFNKACALIGTLPEDKQTLEVERMKPEVTRNFSPPERDRYLEKLDRLLQ